MEKSYINLIMLVKLYIYDEHSGLTEGSLEDLSH